VSASDSSTSDLFAHLPGLEHGEDLGLSPEHDVHFKSISHSPLSAPSLSDDAKTGLGDNVSLNSISSSSSDRGVKRSAWRALGCDWDCVIDEERTEQAKGSDRVQAQRKKNEDAKRVIVKKEHAKSQEEALAAQKMIENEERAVQEVAWQGERKAFEEKAEMWAGERKAWEEKAEMWEVTKAEMAARLKELAAKVTSQADELNTLKDVLAQVVRVTGVTAPTSYTPDAMKQWESGVACRLMYAVGGHESAILAMVSIMAEYPELVTFGVMGCVLEKVPVMHPPANPISPGLPSTGFAGTCPGWRRAQPNCARRTGWCLRRMRGHNGNVGDQSLL
jgi:hypothetical protein